MDDEIHWSEIRKKERFPSGRLKEFIFIRKLNISLRVMCGKIDTKFINRSGDRKPIGIMGSGMNERKSSLYHAISLSSMGIMPDMPRKNGKTAHFTEQLLGILENIDEIEIQNQERAEILFKKTKLHHIKKTKLHHIKKTKRYF